MFDSFLYLIIAADLLVNLLTTKFPYFLIYLFIYLFFLKNGCKTKKEKQTGRMCIVIFSIT